MQIYFVTRRAFKKRWPTAAVIILKIMDLTCTHIMAYHSRRTKLAGAMLFWAVVVVIYFTTRFDATGNTLQMMRRSNKDMPQQVISDSSYAYSSDKHSSDTNSSQTTSGIPVCPMYERLDRFRQACQLHGLGNVNKSTMLEHAAELLVDDKHKLMYLSIPKTGTACWLSTLLLGTGNFTEETLPSFVHDSKRLSRYGLNRLRTYDPVDQEYRLDNYFKFIVVRHPYDRLVSTWREKFTEPESSRLFKALSQKIATMYERPPLDEIEQEWWKDKAMFPEFLHYVQDMDYHNPHWEPYYKTHACSVKWDAILKLESADYDTPEVVKLLEPEYHISKLPVKHSFQKDGQHHLFEKDLAEFDGVLPGVSQYFYQEYYLDFDLFGYSWNNVSHIATCKASNLTQNRMICC